jgi:hypothetical protein
MDALARLVNENGGNEIMDTFNENCKKMQSSYNDKFVPAVTELMNEYKTMSDFNGAIAKTAAKMTRTKAGDSVIQAAKIEIPDL